ncbi:MAG: putative signal transducing protein [Thermodesulfobacteriota bacterium]
MGLEEIYLSYDAMETDLIKGLLENNDIPCFIRDMAVTPYPMSIGKFAEKRISVGSDYVEEATLLIRDAISDGYISSEGKFKK